VRGGWYCQVRRDRFDNEIPSAGLAGSLAIFFWARLDREV
jgi:hypothetical protein